MENILSDCCHPWTENPSNNSCSRQLAIVNAVALIASVVGSINPINPANNCEIVSGVWKRNIWISLIHYSIHFFLSYSLFLIQFCSIFIILFQVCRVILYSECLNPKYSLFILFFYFRSRYSLFIIPLPPPKMVDKRR